MRCDYAHDDGAYVLGALSPAERSAYERHLATCHACREAVAEIAVLPGLLGRLDPATALHLLDADDRAEEETVPPWPMMNRGEATEGRLTSLVGKAVQVRRRERRARRMRYASTALVAACLVLVAAFGVGILGTGGTGGIVGDPDPGSKVSTQMVAMVPVSDEVPVTAKIGLTQHSWGTEITMECAYEKAVKYKKTWQLHLVARGTGNETDQVSSWKASPGDVVPVRGATRFTGDQLVRLELTRADGTPLLVYDVP